ncbi:MAG: hypothetical protein NTZ83_02925 [Candidatus Pacearchaeota archaeon]|nr:hypothetical protein [Candidatus Pacearchaeota archaeon]
MVIELIPDYFEEILQTMKEVNKSIQIMKEKLVEKDKKILELEEKLKRFTQDGS